MFSTSLLSLLTTAIAITALLAHPATAHPSALSDLATIPPSNLTTTTTTNASSTPFTCWAQFCDDAACSVNCGTWVDLMNAGCLNNEAGRGSVHVKSNGPDPLVGLVYSPGTDCNCQSECDDFGGVNPDCWLLNATRAAESGSFRFIGWGRNDGAGGQCDGSGNTCPAEEEAEEGGAEEGGVGNVAGAVADSVGGHGVIVPEEVTKEKLIEEAAAPDEANQEQTATTTTTTLHNRGATLTWGRFCNDANCSTGCGEWVSLDDSSCLSEQYRNSVQVKGTTWNPAVGLVYSPTDACTCQRGCQPLTPQTPFEWCYPLDWTTFAAYSYRFINSGEVAPCASSPDTC